MMLTLTTQLDRLEDTLPPIPARVGALAAAPSSAPPTTR